MTGRDPFYIVRDEIQAAVRAELTPPPPPRALVVPCGWQVAGNPSLAQAAPGA